MATEKKPLPVSLKTVVKDIDNNPVELYLELLIREPARSAYLYVKLPDSNSFREIGGISYYPTKDFKGDRYLHVEHMKNTSGGFTNVGTALHEHAFRESYKLGCGGHVRLSVGSNSHYFHYRCGFSPHPPHVYPEALWVSIFAQLRAKQPKGPLYLVGDDSYDSLHLSDEQIQKKVTAFKMNDPIVAISREMDWVKKTLQSQSKIQFKAILEDNETETYRIFTRPAF